MNLPAQTQKLYDALLGRGDVPIDTLYAALSGSGREDLKQQWLGPYVTRLNRRLVGHKMRVEPGATKGTYRLVAVR